MNGSVIHFCKRAGGRHGAFRSDGFRLSVIQPLLPTKVRGKPRVDDRRVLNGIFWRLRTGAPRADIPVRYSPHTNCVNRFNRWRKAWHLERILRSVSEAYDGDIQMIDGSSVRVHQHGENGALKGAIPLHGSLARWPDDENPCAGRNHRPPDPAEVDQGPGPRRALVILPRFGGHP